MFDVENDGVTISTSVYLYENVAKDRAAACDDMRKVFTGRPDRGYAENRGFPYSSYTNSWYDSKSIVYDDRTKTNVYVRKIGNIKTPNDIPVIVRRFPYVNRYTHSDYYFSARRVIPYPSELDDIDHYEPAFAEKEGG